MVLIFPFFAFSLITTAVGLTTTSSPPVTGPGPVDVDEKKVSEAPIIQPDNGIQVQGEGEGQGHHGLIPNFSGVTKTEEDLLLEWEAPLFFQQNVPYYLAGYDDEGRPVWIVEYGRYPIKQFSELSPEDSQILDKYLQQQALIIYKSIEAQNTTENEVNSGFVILDFDGFNIYQIANPKSVLFIIRIFQAYKDLIINYLGVCIAINVNFVAEMALNIARPIIGRAMEKVEIYGTNSAKWKNVLRRRLPKNTIPSWYGGAPNFKPLKVYG